MAIFQPSNITPSSFAGIGNGVVDANDPAKVTWQVNGSSPLRGWWIDIYLNNDQSAWVDGFGNKNMATPFYGTDSRGNPVLFEATSGTWADVTVQNGYSYKLVITQYWGEYDEQTEEYSNKTVQLSPSAFIARTTPTLSFHSFPSTVNGVSQSFSATYAQAEGDTINWCRWQLQAENDDGDFVTIDDTGTINTANLAYSYNGFISGKTYRISLTVETENGVVVTTGYQSFTVSYSISSTISFPATAVADSSALLRFFDIDATPNPSRNYGSFVDGNLFLNSGSSITWKSRGNGDLYVPKSGYTFGWKGSAGAFSKSYEEAVQNGEKYKVSRVSRDGKTLFVGGTGYTDPVYFIGQYPILDQYSISNGAISKTQRIDLLTLTRLQSVDAMDISPNGTLLAVGEGNMVAILSVFAGSVSLVQYLTPFPTDITCIRFIDDSTVIVGGTNGAYSYAFNGTEWEYSTTFTENGVSVLEIDPLGRIVIGFLSSNAGVLQFFSKTGSAFGPALAPTSGHSYTCHSISFYGLSGFPTATKIVVSLFDETSFVAINRLYSFNGFVYSYVATLPTPTEANSQTVGKLLVLPGNNRLFLSYNNGYHGAYYDISTPDNPVFLYNIYLPQSASDLSFSDSQSTMIAIGRGSSSTEGFLRSYAYQDNTGNSNFLSYYGITIGFRKRYNSIQIFGLTSSIQSVLIRGEELQIVVSPTTATFTFSVNGTVTGTSSFEVTNNRPITSITINGSLNTEYIWVTKGEISDDVGIDGDTYFITNFPSETITANGFVNPDGDISGTVFAKYNNIMKPIATLSPETLNVKDFGVCSNQTYEYLLLLQSTGGFEYYRSVPVCAKWNAYYLIEAAEDPENPNIYHVVNTWRFGNNISAGSVGNNNTPSWQSNFTPYRLRQPSSRMGKSGTLQALLSNVSNCEYSDTTELMESLYALSTSPNTLFLKDMKGNLYMVHTSSPITQTINTKTCNQMVSVSIPWEEIGDSSNVALIQLSSDEGFEMGDSTINA